MSIFSTILRFLLLLNVAALAAEPPDLSWATSSELFDYSRKSVEATRAVIVEINKRLTSPSSIEESQKHFQAQPQIDLYNLEALLYGSLNEWESVLKTREQENFLYPRLRTTAASALLYAYLWVTPPQVRKAYSKLQVAKKNTPVVGIVRLMDRYSAVYREHGERPLQLFFSALKKGLPPELSQPVPVGFFQDASGPIDLTAFAVVDPRPLKELASNYPRSPLVEDAIYALGDCARLAKEYPDNSDLIPKCRLTHPWKKEVAEWRSFIRDFPRSRYTPIAYHELAESLRRKDAEEAAAIERELKENFPDFSVPGLAVDD